MGMNQTKYFVDATGVYIGAFHNSRPPAGAVEVPNGPEHAADKWMGSDWDTTGRPVDDTPLDAEDLYDILETKGVVGAADRPRPKPVRP